MALLTELPSEILNEIILQLYLCSQDQITADPETLHVDQIIQSYNISKIMTWSFTSGIDASSDADGVYPSQSMHLKRNHLLALALTNRRLSSMVTPILYRLVELKKQELYSDEVGPVQRFLLTLGRAPNLADFVHGLSFMALLQSDNETISSQYNVDRLAIARVQRGENPFHEIARWPNSSQVETSSGLRNYFAVIPLSVHYIKLLELLPRLRVLKMDASWNPIHGSYSLEARRVLQSPNVQNLTELSLSDMGLYSTTFDYKTIFIVFQLPKLMTLYLKGICLSGIIHLGVDYSYAVRQSSVVELILDGVFLREESLVSILKLPNGLHRFCYTFKGGPDREDTCVSTTGIKRCLKAHGKTLRSFVIRGRQEHRDHDEEEEFGPFVTEDFPVLEQLAIPLSLISSESPCHTSIPITLKRLQFFAYDEWSLSGWRKHVEDIFEAKRNGLLGLTNLMVEYWLSAENLVMGDTSRTPERLEGILEAIKELVIAGTNVGVQFEVSMDGSSW